MFIIRSFILIALTFMHGAPVNHYHKGGKGCDTAHIKIRGRSVFQNFELNYEFRPDSISFPDLSKLPPGKTTEVISIPASGFRANSRKLEKDFCNLVKADNFPLIKISFTGKESNTDSINIFNLGITIAGITRYYEVIYDIEPAENNNYCIYGSKELSIYDFDLEPPGLIPGLFGVNDRINIFFSVTFEAIT